MSLDKLAKVLSELSGYKRQALISREVLEKYLFSNCTTGFQYIWTFYVEKETMIDAPITEDAFIRTSEKMLAAITDKDQIQFYLKVFSKGKENLSQSAFMDFLWSAYVMYMTMNKLGTEQDTDRNSVTTVAWMETVFKSAYHIKKDMSIFFLTNWILTNTPRLLVPMHKYIIHQLTTSWAVLKNVKINSSSPTSAISKNSTSPEQAKQSEQTASGDVIDPTSILIHPVLMWLLRSSLSTKFLTVLEKKPEGLAPALTNGATSPQQLMQNLMLADQPVRESWALLYDSDDQGLSINRFQHHVFNYRGPTLMFVKADNDYLFCIASDIEWRESCHFWGGEESMLLMVKPEFRVIEKGAKLLYANFSIRGYPFGIQVGKDPRNLSIEIKPEFNYVSYKQIPCKLLRFLAWGCAPPEVKASQTDLRKWEAKQAEKNRKINLNNPEWKDNPDKYLLELAGSYKSYDNQ